MVLKCLKLHHQNGVTRTFSYTQAWVSEEGQKFEKLIKKDCYLSFEW